MATLPCYGVAAEVGVLDGQFSQQILQKNSPRRFYLIDCWQCPPGWDPLTVDKINQDYLKSYYTLLERYANNPAVRILREWSLAAATLFPKDYFDWVYIDADHIQVAQDINAWLPKVKQGGYLLGHDYCGDNPVAKDVDQFSKVNNLPYFLTQERLATWVFQKRTKE